MSAEKTPAGEHKPDVTYVREAALQPTVQGEALRGNHSRDRSGAQTQGNDGGRGMHPPCALSDDRHRVHGRNHRHLRGHAHQELRDLLRPPPQLLSGRRGQPRHGRRQGQQVSGACDRQAARLHVEGSGGRTPRPRWACLGSAVRGRCWHCPPPVKCVECGNAPRMCVPYICMSEFLRASRSGI